MQRKRKDKKITILDCFTEEDEIGNLIEEWKPKFKDIWAHYRHLSGKEIFSAAVVREKVEVVFEINWRADIDTFMKVLYKDEEYRITDIDDFEGKKTDLKIYAYKIN